MVKAFRKILLEDSFVTFMYGECMRGGGVVISREAMLLDVFLLDLAHCLLWAIATYSQ